MILIIKKLLETTWKSAENGILPIWHFWVFYFYGIQDYENA